MWRALLILAALACATGAHAGPQSGVPNTLDVTDGSNLPFTGVVAMTVGTTYPAGKSLYVNCTASGNVKVLFYDGSMLTFPVNVGITILPFAVTQVVSSGTTATATYAELMWEPQ
jgi:hypothetical protein